MEVTIQTLVEKIYFVQGPLAVRHALLKLKKKGWAFNKVPLAGLLEDDVFHMYLYDDPSSSCQMNPFRYGNWNM
jgi:hypothetical protein